MNQVFQRRSMVKWKESYSDLLPECPALAYPPMWMEIEVACSLSQGSKDTLWLHNSHVIICNSIAALPHAEWLLIEDKSEVDVLVRDSRGRWWRETYNEGQSYLKEQAQSPHKRPLSLLILIVSTNATYHVSNKCGSSGFYVVSSGMLRRILGICEALCPRQTTQAASVNCSKTKTNPAD